MMSTGAWGQDIIHNWLNMPSFIMPDVMDIPPASQLRNIPAGLDLNDLLLNGNQSRQTADRLYIEIKFGTELK